MAKKGKIVKGKIVYVSIVPGSQSTRVTHDAFHENWHARSSAVKKLFCTMEMGNNIECRLSAYRIVELVVPSLAQVNAKTLFLQR